MEVLIMEETYVTSTNRTIAHTFLWMFLGLIATGIIAGVTYYSGLVVSMLEWWNIILIAQVVIAVVFGLLFHKLSSNAVTFLFFVYSMLTRCYIFSNICNI